MRSVDQYRHAQQVVASGMNDFDIANCHTSGTSVRVATRQAAKPGPVECVAVRHYLRRTDVGTRPTLTD